LASSTLSGEASDASDNLSSNTPSEEVDNSEYDESDSAPYNFASFRFKLVNRTSTHHRKCKALKNKTTVNRSHIKTNRSSAFNMITDFKLPNKTALKPLKVVKKAVSVPMSGVVVNDTKKAVNELPRVPKQGD